MSNSQTVVVLGASPKPERYSNLAVRRLKEQGHHVIPVHPREALIESLPAVPVLGDIVAPVDTLTVYVNPARSAALAQAVLKLRPRRAIFNPGAEAPTLQARLRQAGVEVVEGCTLVMLQTGTF